MKNIVLLRGLVRESRHWGDFPHKLKNELKEYEILTPEIQGVGQYTNIDSPDNLIDMIEFMREQIKGKLNQDTIIIAISLGGMIAKQWSEKYPNDFKKMILINTSFKGLNPIFHRLKPNAILQFLNIAITPHIGMRERKILNLISNVEEKRQENHHNWVEIQKESPVSHKSFINQIKAALKFKPSETPPELDSLIIAAKKDRLCHYNCSTTLSKKWNIPLKLHQTAGHDLPMDDPTWLIKTIKEFIKK